jgi:hypothetical protein
MIRREAIRIVALTLGIASAVALFGFRGDGPGDSGLIVALLALWFASITSLFEVGARKSRTSKRAWAIVGWIPSILVVVSVVGWRQLEAVGVDDAVVYLAGWVLLLVLLVVASWGRWHGGPKVAFRLGMAVAALAVALVGQFAWVMSGDDLDMAGVVLLVVGPAWLSAMLAWDLPGLARGGD